MARTIATNTAVGRDELLEFVRPRHHMLLVTEREDGGSRVVITALEGTVSWTEDGEEQVRRVTWDGECLDVAEESDMDEEGSSDPTFCLTDGWRGVGIDELAVVVTEDDGWRVDPLATVTDYAQAMLPELSEEMVLRGLGYPEVAEPTGEVTGSWLKQQFAGRTAPVKSMLMDQRIIAGLGNIYVCEALYRARIDPRKPAGKISRARLDALAEAIPEVLDEAIAAGGSTLKDFISPDGELGYFAKDFAVYDREGQPCACGGMVKRVVQAGRSTFFCPSCQR